MRYIFLVLIISACNSPSKPQDDLSKDVPVKDVVLEKKVSGKLPENESFRIISIDSLSDETISISGEARVFEGTLYYYLRQGKEESDDEFVTASAGAPEWGKFNFTINPSLYKNSEPLYLFLFEPSAKDGSRIHELKIKIW